MSETPTTSTLVGKAIGSLLSNGILAWSAFETTGLIHGVLIGYLAFVAVVLVIHGAITIGSEPKRPVYGDVHVNLKGDASQLTDAMARVRNLS